MAKRKNQRGVRKGARQKVSVLDRLKPEEAQSVLHRLLAAHPELQTEAGQVAESLLREVSFECIADEVEEDVCAMNPDELESLAGAHSWGYTSPSDAAWELLEERISPYMEDMERQFELGLEAEALEICKGVVLGLYRVRDQKDNDILEWAADFPDETACVAISAWRKGGGGKRSSRKRPAFPPDFVTEFVPEWKDLIDRA